MTVTTQPEQQSPQHTRKRKFSRIGAGIAAAAIALGGGVVASPEASAEVGGWYNIRSGPGLKYPVVGKMYNPDCRQLGTGGPVRADGYIWSPVNSGHTRGWSINDDWCI